MKKLKLLVLLTLIPVAFAMAQQQVSGKITDVGGNPIPGVNIIVKNTMRGTSSDVNGNYTIVAKSGDILEFSFIGYKPHSVTVANQTNLSIVLQEDTSQLDEIVVTSLGVKKEKRALGYSVAEIKSQDIGRVRVNNVVNALAGQASGVQVTGTSNGLASSSRIIIRGENSLNINNNQPLFVLDGVPVNNEIFGVGGNSTNQTDLPTDYGNAIAELNPDDFESVMVLKGAAASALYGSRAANGVILITTKTGNQTPQGLGVALSSSVTFSSQMDLLDIQKQYGGGFSGVYGSNLGTNYGPALNGNNVNQELALGEFVERPFVNRYNLNDFFEVGVNHFNTVALSGANDQGYFRLSYANRNSTGFIPNTDLRSNSFRLNAGYQLTDKWSVKGYANYITRGSDNLPVAGYGSQGLMYVLMWNYLNVDLKDLRNYWNTENLEQRKLFSWGDNPWFVAHENINAFDKNRFLGNVTSTYQITKELSLMGRVGIDRSDDFRWSRRSIGAQRNPNGMYREQKIQFSEINADFLLTYEKKFGDFETRFSAGGVRFDQKITQSLLQGNGLAIPNLYNAQNISVTPLLRNEAFEKRINSLYGFANIGYKNYLYLELSARNDWSSTLSLANNSFFYPAASLSFIPTAIFSMPDYIDFLKLRLNVAQVGKDADPYNLVNTYNFGQLQGSLTNTSALLNANLKPERTVSTELGLEAYLFERRISFNATYYNAVSKDQILNVGISTAGGFASKIINAGEIKNFGWEIGLGIVPVRTQDFEWGIKANFTRNNSEVVSLFENLNTFIIAEGPDNITVEARPGGRMGDIYGQVYQRNDEGKIIYQNGLPLTSTQKQKVGNYNPDFMLGLSTQVSWKGFQFYALVDIRKGGKIYSYTNAIGRESGTLGFTVPWRDGVIGEGVMRDDNGNFVPNNVEVSAEAWAYAVPRSNAEANLFDASYVKLRQLSLGYTFKKGFIERLRLQELSVSLIGSNLFLWTDVPNIDPESQALNGGTLVPGMEVVQLPSTRNYGFKIDVKF